jgi:hypothetical protein
MQRPTYLDGRFLEEVATQIYKQRPNFLGNRMLTNAEVTEEHGREPCMNHTNSWRYNPVKKIHQQKSYHY